jgi:hypothetical protein
VVGLGERVDGVDVGESPHRVRLASASGPPEDSTYGWRPPSRRQSLGSGLAGLSGNPRTARRRAGRRQSPGRRPLASQGFHARAADAARRQSPGLRPIR